MAHIVAPSVLAADFRHLQKEFDLVNGSEADWFHVDIMDGRFVPNISFGMDIVKTMKGMAEKPLDVHLMIVEPERYIEQFRAAGADRITVHYEACPHLHRVLQALLDLPVPEYHHHGLICDESGKRLAKRDEAETLRSLREAGTAPDQVRRRLGFDR